MKPVRVLYDNGLPWVSTKQRLERLVDSCKNRIENNLPAVVIFDGPSGAGKTTGAVQFAKVYQGRPFVPRIQLGNGVEDFKQKLEMCKDEGYPVAIFDEAGEANRKSSPSKINRTITRVFELMRAYKILIIICLPRFYFLEPDILQLGVIRALIHMKRKPGVPYSDFKLYRVKQMMMIRYWVKKLANPMDAYNYGVPQGRGHMLDLPPEESRSLADYSLGAKRVEMKKQILNIKDRVTLEQIANHFQKSPRWVLKKLKEVDDVGDVKVFQKKKWYQKEIIQRIEELED